MHIISVSLHALFLNLLLFLLQNDSKCKALLVAPGSK